MLGRSAADLRRRRLATWLALCLFALRTLVPIGFMVSVEASHAAVTLCPDYAPLPASAAAQHAHHHGLQHQHSGAGGPHPPGAESHGLCPFAGAGHSPSHAVAPAAAAAPPALAGSLAAVAADAAPARFHHPTSHSPRGPPAPHLG
jgi:hypothetical protein